MGETVQVGMIHVERPPEVVRMWLDDERPPPDGWNYWAKDAATARAVVELASQGKHRLEAIGFDHDLGCGGDAHVVALDVEFGAFYGDLPRMRWEVHSMNPAGAARIEATMRSADRFWDKRERGLDPRPCGG